MFKDMTVSNTTMEEFKNHITQSGVRLAAFYSWQAADYSWQAADYLWKAGDSSWKAADYSWQAQSYSWQAADYTAAIYVYLILKLVNQEY
jgi:hypothetical protein